MGPTGTVVDKAREFHGGRSPAPQLRHRRPISPFRELDAIRGQKARVNLPDPLFTRGIETKRCVRVETGTNSRAADAPIAVEESPHVVRHPLQRNAREPLLPNDGLIDERQHELPVRTRIELATEMGCDLSEK